MERLGISKKAQQKFFRAIKAVSKLNWAKLAQFCAVTDRTLRDWARGRYTASYKVYVLLSEKFSVPLPKGRVLESYWYVKKSSKLGGFARYRKYGLLGNKETRQKGGLISQKLIENKFTPSLVKKSKIYIYNISEVKRYFDVVGSHNPKHISRLNEHLNYLQNRLSLSNWKRAGVAERA